MSYVAKISLPGYDVNTATVDQCVLHSEYPSPLIDESNIGLFTYLFDTDLAASSTRNLFTVAHGYSFIPSSMCLVMIHEPITGGSYAIMAPYSDSSFNIRIQAYCDDTNFYIDLHNYNVFDYHDDIEYKFKYYIFGSDGT